MKNMLVAMGILCLVMSLNAGATIVLYEDGREPVHLESMLVDSLPYYRFDEFCSALGGSWIWHPSIEVATMGLGDDSLTVTGGSSFFRLNNSSLHSPDPVIFRNGYIWIPRHFLSSVNLLFSGVTTRFSAEGDSVFVENNGCDIHVLSFRQDSLTTTLSLILPSGSSWDMSPFRNRQCSVRIMGAAVCTDEIDSLNVKDPLRSLYAEQSLGKSVINFRFSTSELSVHARQPAGGGPLTISIEQSAEVDENEDAKARQYKVRTVVIDPGHGGEDEGIRSTRGISEKDVTASIASNIISILERRSPDIETVLTRTDDTYAGLESRIESANYHKGDIFISIHCNASFNRSLKGFQAYFLSPSVTDAARFVAARENAVIPGENAGAPTDSGLVFLQWDRIQDSWLTYSMMLTRSITEAARRRLDTTVRDPAQAALYVLSGVDMPSVLIEVGYLTNSLEARKLADSQYLEQVALTIVEGIEMYMRELDNLSSKDEISLQSHSD